MSATYEELLELENKRHSNKLAELNLVHINNKEITRIEFANSKKIQEIIVYDSNNILNTKRKDSLELMEIGKQ